MAVPATAQAAPPTDPQCLPLVAGATGLPFISGSIPSAGPLTGNGVGAVATTALPRKVWIKDSRHAVSNSAAFILRGADLYVARAHLGAVDPGQTWHRVDLPSCLAGRITAITADGGTLIAIGPGRQVYTNDLAGGGVPPERWTWRWGPFLWLGEGFSLSPDVTAQAYSDFGSGETFTDSAGRKHHPIGVGTYYLLNGQGSRIVPEDPWLPMDDSRAVCLPQQGTARVANLDASGSTIFAVTKAGRLYTRMYDFDLTGANAIFGSYTWQAGVAKSDQRWQLPIADWRQQPLPPGRITDAITIVRTGSDASQRQLRVTGRSQGRNGVWTKSINGSRWQFTPVIGPLTGRAFPMTNTMYRPPLVRYQGKIAGSDAVVSGFDWTCTPTAMRVQVAPRIWLPLQVWAYDGLRQANRSSGLSDVPRTYNAAIIVSPAVWRTLSGSAKAWVQKNLAGRITETQLQVTSTKFTFVRNCWKLTKNGQPARPDQPSLDPVATLTGPKATC